MREKIWIVLIIMGAGIYFTFPKQEETTYNNQEAIDVAPIAVVVSGEVNLPDTYYFFDEPTVNDVINMAGGLTASADESSVSRNQVIEENTTLTITSKTEETEEVSIMVNVNDASFAELLNVPYMSESRAAYIIMYREEHGDFQSLDDLVNVKYIGAATLENIRPYLTT